LEKVGSMRVRYRRRAKLDVENLYRYIGERDQHAATSVAARIRFAVSRLGAWPYMGHVGSAAKTYEWIVAGLPFVIVYEVDEVANEIAIIAVFHCAQDRP